MKKNFLNIVLLSLFLLWSGSLGGCFYDYADFKPTKDQTPIILFNCYKADISGYAEGRHNLICEFTFLQPLIDTTNLDTIPILILDSICFYGACLDSNFCLRPTSWWEEGQESLRKGWGCTRCERLIRDKDLYYSYCFEECENIVPSGFDLYDAFRFPENCNKNDITVKLQARILDRVTGAEIARESRIIQFRIKRGSRLGMS